MKLPINIRIFLTNLFGEKRFCYACGEKMKAITIAYNNLNDSDCIVYQCPKCTSTLYSPIENVKEEEHKKDIIEENVNDFLGEEDLDYGDLADSIAQMNEDFESQNNL